MLRTYTLTLTASDTVGFSQGLVERRADRDLRASMNEGDRSDVLNLVANAHTRAAKNTFSRVAHDALRGFVNIGLCMSDRESYIGKSVYLCKITKLARALLGAKSTVGTVS